jgi:ribonuclease BN (tRNA processing enzyme)
MATDRSDHRRRSRFRLPLALAGILSAALSATSSRSAPPVSCPAAAVALQVLGSGGPIAEDDRAGTSYLLRIDGVPRLLVDIGAGSFLRFGQAGAALQTLDGIAITHFHTDHVGDLVGILKSGSFEERSNPLPIFGPAGDGRFPGLNDYLQRLLSPTTGTYGYLGGYLDGSEDKPRLDPSEIPTAEGTAPNIVRVLPHGITLTFVPVHHGAVPALGLVIAVGGKTIVIGGDQSRFSEAFASYLTETRPDLLIAHHVVPDGPGQPLGLHRNPTSIGELAQTMGAHRLVLSHNMRRSLSRLDEGLAAIGKNYAGAVSVARDLECFVP